MFYTDSNNNRYRIGKPFEYEGYYYGTALATHAKFIELGFTQVIVQQRPDSFYYISSGPDNNGAYTSTPRDLDTVKLTLISKQKLHANQLLSPTDWYVVRSTELNGVATAAVPTNITEFRSSVRTVCDARCAEINACTTIEELETRVTAPAKILVETIPGVADVSTTEYIMGDNPDALTQWPTNEESN